MTKPFIPSNFKYLVVFAVVVWGFILFTNYNSKYEQDNTQDHHESTLAIPTEQFTTNAPPINNAVSNIKHDDSVVNSINSNNSKINDDTMKESKCITESKIDLWHDEDYYLHANEDLPLLKSIPNEYEYYSRGIVMKGLHEYPTLKSMIENDCNETSGENSVEYLSKLSSDELKSLFFTPNLVGALNSSLNTCGNRLFMNDLHQDKGLYTVEKRKYNTKQFEINTKVSTLLVHTLFAYNLELNEEVAHYPVISDESRLRYCNNTLTCKGGAHLCAICEEFKIPKTKSKYFYAKPWCFESNMDYSLLSIQDGILDNGVTHGDVPGALFDKNGNIVVMSTPHSLKFKSDAQLHYIPQFAYPGIIYNPTAAGHFPIEGLPRIVFLSYFLPLHIPILMNNIPSNKRMIEQFQESGIIHSKRKFIWASGGHYYMGKRVYFLHSREYLRYAPLTPDLVMRIASTLYSKAYAANLNLNPMLKLTTRKEYILVVDRSDVGNRMIVNQDYLIGNITQFLHPLDIDVIPVKLGQLKSFMEIGASFYGAIAVIAPHGAGLANLNAVNREKIKFIMEVGWKGGWPADYWCGSRSIGVKYISIVCETGRFEVDIDEVMQHLKREFKDYKK